ncbi:MAG: MoaD/ThiS family protein [Candidatus Micrarchaeia archaeon]
MACNINVRFSSALRGSTNGANNAVVQSADNVKDAVKVLCEKFGEGFQRKVLDETGNLHNHVAIYKNGEDLRFSNGLESALLDNDELLILPAVSGG